MVDRADAAQPHESEGSEGAGEHRLGEPTHQEHPPRRTHQERSRVGRSWLRVQSLVLIIFLVMTAWFAWDGFVAWPRRGQESVRFALLDYLDETDVHNALIEVSVPDPALTLAELAEQSQAAELGALERSRFLWLQQLSHIADLEAIGAAQAAGEAVAPAYRTVFPEPREELARLRKQLGQQSPPKPLSHLDLPMQYVFFGLGAAGCLLIGANIVRTVSRTYRYDHAGHRLTLPDGRSFTPQELLEVDKRKWDRFFVFLTVAGIDGEIKIDLKKHEPVEQWVLEMERLSPHVETPAEEAAEQADAEVVAEEGAGI